MSLKNSAIIIILVMGCTGVTFNPNWHVGDAEQQAIVPAEGHPVYCHEPEFNNYACMHKDKVIELKEILSRARLPFAQKKKIIKKLDEALHQSSDSGSSK